MTLSAIELAVLVFCAITLGVVIHFFIVSKRNLKSSPIEKQKIQKNLEDWKLKYFNEIEVKDKELTELRKRLSEAEDNSQIYQIEIEELQKIKKAHPEIQSGHAVEHVTKRSDYLEELRLAQLNLLEQHEKINQLLENVEVTRENDEKQKLLEEENEILIKEVRELRYLSEQREIEMNAVRKKEKLTQEMTSMLDNAYNDFNDLQEKIERLESQLSSSKMVSLEHEDLKEAHYKISRDYEEQKHKLQAFILENQQQTLRLNEAEDKLREAIFQRQQLQKRVSYLEELNKDLQIVADANKKLEHQLRRIGELESMLNVVAEERDMLKRKEK